MSDIPDSIFDSIARLLPAADREHFYRRMARLRDLSPNDDMLQIAEAMGFLTLLIRDTPLLIAAERLSLEAAFDRTLASFQDLHRKTINANRQIQERLDNLPAEILAGITPETIAAQIAESIRQHLAQDHLPTIIEELRCHTVTITQATQQLADAAAILADSEHGPTARVRNVLSLMQANLTNAATHVRSITALLHTETRQALVILCTVGILSGFLLGWLLRK